VLIAAVALLLAAFLTGFVPQFQKASRLQDELRARDQRLQQLQREGEFAKARDLASLLYLELTRKNYGIAAEHAAGFFTQVRSIANGTSDPGLKNALDQMAGQRDEITANIAKADPAVETPVREILQRMHQLAAR
jgi:hypothetical protein